MKVKKLIQRLKSVPDIDLNVYFRNDDCQSKYDFGYLTYDESQDAYFICFDESTKLAPKKE